MSIQMRFRYGFSMIEMLMVLSIVGVVSAITIPRFADASSGRKLQAASNMIKGDIEIVKMRSRARSVSHTLKFYPDRDMYVISEGEGLTKDSVILSRSMALGELGVGIKRMSYAADQIIFISRYGDVFPSGKIEIEINGASTLVGIGGVTGYTAVTSDKLSADDLNSLQRNPLNLDRINE